MIFDVLCKRKAITSKSFGNHTDHSDPKADHTKNVGNHSDHTDHTTF